jgi:hypothetical protein
VLFSRRYLVSGGGRWPIFRVQREYGRLASGSEDVKDHALDRENWSDLLLSRLLDETEEKRWKKKRGLPSKDMRCLPHDLLDLLANRVE